MVNANAAAALERQLSGDQELFAQKLQEISDLKSELSAKDASIAALEMQLVGAQAALAAQTVQGVAYEVESGVVAAKQTQAAPGAALDVATALDSPLMLIEERQAAQIGALKAELSAGEDRLAATAEQLSEFQAVAAAQESEVRALRSELSARHEAAAMLNAELSASEETVASLQADLEAERQLAYTQSAAHSLAQELAGHRVQLEAHQASSFHSCLNADRVSIN